MSETQDLENTIIIELKDGPVTIKLLPDVAPQHCARMIELARSGQYDNVCFHRVIDGFMAQTGDVQNGDMEDDPNSANSQFFINFSDNHFLNGQYTVYGMVTSGMEHVDAIVRGEPPHAPDRMISVKVAADA